MANLYNKHRPQKFAEVVGQAAAIKTLQNQVKTQTFSHAYLFTGTRGTGKTTCARIFARAINCTNTSDGEPCNNCELCRDFLTAASTDIIEIDAASNSSVDNIRKMTEEIAYAPMYAKYKIYIIDEVHMLSGSAFNALLKTLEEPPEHAVFILATTEIHKVPATIQSRCQRFDFYRLRTHEIAEQLKKIAGLENKTLPEQSIEAVAELGDGSMRDAISVLDKVLELETEEEIREVLGIIDRQTTFNMIKAIAENDSESLLLSINEIYYKIGDLSNLCKDLLTQFRSMLVIKNVKDYKTILDTTDAAIKTLAELSDKFTTEKILFCVSVLQQTISILQFSKNKRDDVEICLLKISRPELENTTEALTARVSLLEKQLAELKTTGINVVQSKNKRTISKKDAQKKTEVEEDITAETEASIPEQKQNTKPIAEKHTEEPLNEVTTANEPGDDKFHEYLLWDDICSIIKPKAIRAAMELRDYAIPLVRNNEIIIICNDDGTKRLADKNIELIKSAFISHKKEVSSIKTVVGTRQDYIDETHIYDNLENNEFLKFE